MEADHKTVAVLRERKAFTLAVPSTATLAESDYLCGVGTKGYPLGARALY